MKKVGNAGLVHDFLSDHTTSTRDGEAAWKSWLDLKDQEWRDLVILIGSDVRGEFKKRALAVLFAPDLRCLPFEWREDVASENYLFLQGNDDLITISELSRELRDFVAELIRLGALELVATREHDGRADRFLCYYNRYILDFLKILPKNDPMAEKLFSVYQLGDISGHHPIHPILNEDIPRKWKKRAVARTHEIILAEVKDQSKSRAPDRKALRCYVREITPSSGCKNYGVKLFASQVEFVLGLPGIRNLALFDGFNLCSMLQILSGDQYRDLRHRLARYVVLENTGEFSQYEIYEKDTKRSAEAMLSEFASDQELSTALRKALVKAKKHFQEDAKYRSSQEIKEQAVLSRMA